MANKFNLRVRQTFLFLFAPGKRKTNPEIGGTRNREVFRPSWRKVFRVVESAMTQRSVPMCRHALVTSRPENERL